MFYPLEPIELVILWNSELICKLCKEEKPLPQLKIKVRFLSCAARILTAIPTSAWLINILTDVEMGASFVLLAR
jgi:hypothetical protein